MGEDHRLLMEAVKSQNCTKNGGRQRKKLLYRKVCEQMEFYFSDANLSKDRYLSQLVEIDPYVPLEVFLKFNKISGMVNSVDAISKALKKSETLELSSDNKHVRRKTPISVRGNEEDRTIYVENLAPETSHEDLKKVFSEFGKVLYVSIPKYANTRAIKGFAFVEFDTPEEATKTIEVFQEKGSCLSSQMLPEKLCSIRTFEDECRDGKSKKVTFKFEHGSQQDFQEGSKAGLQPKISSIKEESVSLLDSDENIVKSKETETEIESSTSKENKLKRKRHVLDTANVDTENDEKARNKKKRKADINSLGLNENESGKKGQNKDLKKFESESDSPLAIDEMAGNSSVNDTAELSTSKESKLKRKRESHDTEKVEDGTDAEAVERKEKHDDLKKKMKCDSKQSDSVNKISSSEEEQENNTAPEQASKSKTKNRNKKKKSKGDKELFAFGLHVLPKKEWKRLRNKYLTMQRTNMKKVKQQLAEARFMKSAWFNPRQNYQEPVEESVPLDTSKARVSFTPGVIIRVGFNEPVVDIKLFKAQAKSQPSVQYVDIHEGSCEAYLRCSSAPDAQEVLQSKFWENMSLVQGNEESAYWEKIFKDREEKLSKKKLPRKQRGREKLIHRAETLLATHLHFDS